jgi:sulfur relay (sulfurtransferase) DsrF/TusC family protein
MGITNQCVIIRHPSYGREDAFAAIRMAIIGQNSDLPTSLVLCEDGIWNAVQDQWSEAIEMPSNEDQLMDALQVGVKVIVDSDSLEERGLTPDDLIEGVTVVPCQEMAEVVLSHDAILPLCGGF